jgi:hypothetical protein
MGRFALHILPCAEKRSLICLGCSPSAVRAAMITTFKRDGPGVPAPVGFCVTGEELYARAPWLRLVG